MNTNQALFFYIMIIGALCVGVEAAAPKTSVPVRRPVSATNTTTKVKAARYNNVKNAASRFDKYFQSVPTTPEEMKRVLARMIAADASQEDFMRFYESFDGCKFVYLVSSVMLSRATSPKDRAMCHSFYSHDLAFCLDNGPGKRPAFVTAELESALDEAIKNDIHMEKPAVVGAVLYALSAYYGDVNRSWSLYKKFDVIIKKSDCVHSTYIGNMAYSVEYEGQRSRLSSETIRQMKEYFTRMLCDDNLSIRLKYQCQQLVESLSNAQKGGGIDNIP